MRSSRRLRKGEPAALLRSLHLELLALVALAAVLDTWSLTRNGWANEYYAAADRSMAASWHDFLFASMDKAGVMTVDKPPLALWVQALSVRLFGYHPLAILLPQALMGIATVVLLYDLVRRRFGRLGGFVAGTALALTPITVAMSRHNNPDALLVLLTVAALWCTQRGLEGGRTRWLVAAGVCVGLGFETKMALALAIVPGIALAWLWLVPAARGLWHAVRQLLWGGLAMLLVGGAWPLLVELTPAADRPWISGTSDNTVWSLIFEYNGVGRVGGQAGGPGVISAGVDFGGSPGPLRLLNTALGGQAGWLLGFALVGLVAIVARTRLRRREPATGWLIALGLSFLIVAGVFSSAHGIFHPYYVSLLAPFVAAFVGAGAAQLLSWPRGARILGPFAIAAGVAAELYVRGRYTDQMPWLVGVLIAVGVLTALAVGIAPLAAIRRAGVLAVLAVLAIAPAVWAFDTLDHATDGTFPAGGPTAVAEAGVGGPAGGPGGQGGLPGGLFGRGGAGPRGAGGAGSLPAGAGAGAAPGVAGAGGGPGAAGARGGNIIGELDLFGRSGREAGAGSQLAPSGGGAPAGGAAQFGADTTDLKRAISYARDHGGGAIAVDSQSSAAAAIITEDAEVAGIGGFSGRESDISIGWLAQAVRGGRIRWVLDEETFEAGAYLSGRDTASSRAARLTAPAAGFPGAGGGGVAGPRPGGAAAAGPFEGRRPGSRVAIAAAAKACRKVTIASGRDVSAGLYLRRSGVTLYDCRGRAKALEAVARRYSKA